MESGSLPVKSGELAGLSPNVNLSKDCAFQLKSFDNVIKLRNGI